MSEEKKHSAWPPPPVPRLRWLKWERTALVTTVTISLLILVAASGLLIYGTTRGYAHAIKRNNQIETQQAVNATGTVQARIQGTRQALNQSQQAIEATATTQGLQTAQQATATAGISATAQADQDQLTLWTSGTPQFTNALSDNQGTGGWDQGGASSYVGCTFADGSYHASENQLSMLQPCIAQETGFTNFAYQINMTNEKGNHAQSGLLFRVDSTNTAYYFYYISTDGNYGVDYYSDNGTPVSLVQGSSDTINTEVGASNQLTVIANKNQFTLFANGQYLDQLQDNHLTSGKIGVGVVDNETPARISFTNAQVWQYKESTTKR